LETLLDKFSKEEEEAGKKVEDKYSKIISQTESLPQAIREASLKKFKASMEKEMNNELNAIKEKEQVERNKLLTSYSKRIQELMNQEQCLELTEKIKENFHSTTQKRDKPNKGNNIKNNKAKIENTTESIADVLNSLHLSIYDSTLLSEMKKKSEEIYSKL